ncbi:hypothetical protein IW261DRAFT_1482183 [Armillaria novae-zelandiae]|uniref:Uncharacterized protein n=1 Tax=Armillaria novae-zelandiae TaxID=153914 RepID=A0AA39TBK0_9AGAR|nr:hypothetical protein IW261DRAFT_1482183 [Armillaria novae-zelandiae]
MNLTTGCSNRNDQTCQISCQDPSNSNQCVLLSSLLIDGSPCGMCVVFHWARIAYPNHGQVMVVAVNQVLARVEVL